MILIMVLMAVTSTASAEVMAVTSIVIYDMYAVYLKPYRLTTETNSCILCGRGRGRMANPRDKCICVSMTTCDKCQQDTKSREESLRAIKPEYKCHVHGNYRAYNDYLSHLKNWTVIWTTMAVIPFTIILFMIQVSLSWLYLFMGVLIGSAVIPVTLTMFWERLTALGLMSGTVGGTVLALVVWLGVASSYEGGLNDWWKNTGQEMAMLAGNLAAILGGGVITVVVSFITSFRADVTLGEEIWENTRDIDNPLSPWMEKYRLELNISVSELLENRPSLAAVQSAFKSASLLAYSLSAILALLLVVFWPAVMVAVGVMTESQFLGWVRLAEIWVFLAMVSMILLPLVNEVVDISTKLRSARKVIPTSNIETGPILKGQTQELQPRPQLNSAKEVL